MKTREIAELLGAELVGDGEVDIVAVASADTATEGDIAFVSKANAGIGGSPSCVIGSLEFSASEFPVIKVADPKLAFAKVAESLYKDRNGSFETHPTAVVSESADVALEISIDAFVCIGRGTKIGSLTRIGSGSKIGDDVTIGRNCILHPNVVIENGSTIGDNVILHAGVVIGADGFGYVRDEDRYVKFPQIGTVVIEDDVEIGANSCVDRAALGVTVIGDGTKLDNMVHIGHNVHVGRNVVISAQTGVAGSSVIEQNVVIAGQVGIADHVHVEEGAILGAQCGVPSHKVIRGRGIVFWGTPARPLRDYLREVAALARLVRKK